VVLSLDRSSLVWPEPLKLSSARCCLWSAQPSVFRFAFASLSFFFYSFCPPLRVLLRPSTLPVHGFKAIHSHGCSIPLPLPVGLPDIASLGVPYSVSCSGSQGVATCPPTAVPTSFIGLVLPLHCGMSLLPPWKSNRMSNIYKLWLNPSSIPFSPSDVISAIRSQASRSNAIGMFRAVYLLDR